MKCERIENLKGSGKNVSAYLRDLIRTGEGYHLEFKKSLDKSFPEEVCAFANASGGKVLLGVSDDGAIAGISSDNAFLSRIQDMVNQIEPPIDVDISATDSVVIVDVPEGREKPYGCARGFFVRIGPNAQKLTRNQIVSFYQKEGRIRFDELENQKADFKRDFDDAAFNNFLRLASITPSIDKQFLLTNLDCLSANGRLTNAGALFFSKSVEFLLLQATVTCVLYKGTEKFRVLDRKDFSGNILENIENAVIFVMRHTNLEYKIEKLRREEISEIPEVALREAVVNAVCHRDYFEKGANVMVEIFDDRLEISNPGGLPAGLTPQTFGTKSVVRNPIIAALLHRAGYIEKIGTGVKRMENAVKEHGRGRVTFFFDSFFSVLFTRPKPNDRALEKTACVQEGMTRETTRKIEKTAQETAPRNGETTQESIFNLLKNDPSLTRRKLAEHVGLTPDGVKYHLNKLREKGIIRHVGATKKGYWEILKKFQR